MGQKTKIFNYRAANGLLAEIEEDIWHGRDGERRTRYFSIFRLEQKKDGTWYRRYAIKPREMEDFVDCLGRIQEFLDHGTMPQQPKPAYENAQGDIAFGAEEDPNF